MRILIALALLSSSAFAKPAPKTPAKPVAAVKPAADELTEIEALRYEVAFLKAQRIQAACEALPEYKQAADAVRAVVEAIDAAHHIDRNAGDKFNPETRKIEREPKPEPPASKAPAASKAKSP